MIYTSSLPYDVTANFNLEEGEYILNIFAGKEHAMAITSFDKVYGWGYNNYYELGLGNNSSQNMPIEITPYLNLAVGETITTIGLGDSSSILVTSEGNVIAMGYNSSGQLGNGTTVQITTPTVITANYNIAVGDSIQKISMYTHTLMITADGDRFSWGNNYDGQVGNGTTTNVLTPTLYTTSGWNYYNSQQFDYQETIVLITSPTRTGYDFDGWFTDASCTIPFVLTEMPSNDVTLYAKWVVN